MKKSLVCFGVAALAALLLTGASAQAQPIPWIYGTISPSPISATSGPLSTVKFTGSSGNPTGDSGIIIYTVTAVSTNDGVSFPADSFNNVPFNLAINLTDGKALEAAPGSAKTTGTVNFSGMFNATNVTTKSLLPGVNSWSLVPGNLSETTAFVNLGSNDPAIGWRKYTVELKSFTSPGQPGGAPGSIQAVVTISPGTPDGSGEIPDQNFTPEPASFLLAALGLPVFVMIRRRLKKNQD